MPGRGCLGGGAWVRQGPLSPHFDFIGYVSLDDTDAELCKGNFRVALSGPRTQQHSAGSPSPIPLSAGPGCQAVLLFSESGRWLWSLVPEMESWGHRRRGPRARQAKAAGTGVMGGGTGGGGPGHSGQLSQGMAARRGGGSLHF